MTKTIIGLTDEGRKKLKDHVHLAKQTDLMSLDEAFDDLVEVITPQINNSLPRLARSPWYYAIGVAGTTYPSSLEEHETSDYEEIDFCYYESDVLLEETRISD